MDERTETPRSGELTPDDVKAMGRELLDLVGRIMTVEDLMRMPGPAEALRRERDAAAAALRREREAAAEALRREREAARKVVEAAQEATRKALVVAKADLLQELIVKKFGAVPDWVSNRLADADADELARLSERILTAETIDAVFPPDPAG